jgi:hypothetical protein
MVMIGFLKAFLGIAIMMAFWVLVQRAWLLRFPDRNGETDALACRGGCGSCSGKCQNIQNSRKTTPDRERTDRGSS